MAVVPFKRPVRTQAPAEKHNAEAGMVGMESDAVSVLFKALQKSGIRSFFTDVELPMQQHLNSLVGYVKPSNVNDWKKKLCFETDDTLREIAKKSTQYDWTQRPAYFHALLAVIQERSISEKEADEKK